VRVRRSTTLTFRGACIAAGSLFFCGGGTPATAAEPDEPPRLLTFAAWNLHNYHHTVRAPAPPEPGGSKPKPAAAVECITRILASLQPDIAGLCEVGGPEDLAALQQRLKAAGLDMPHSEFVPAADSARHLALLSRHPIASRQSQPQLNYLLDESKLPVQRGFLDVTVQVNGDYRLRCLGAHLKSRRDVPDANEGLMRRNEAHLLRQYADSILTAEPDTNLLVYGDFNDTRDQPSIRALVGVRGAATYLTAITPADAVGQRWTYYYPEADTYSRVDFLLASRGLNPEIENDQCFIYSGADWFTASDHRAITAVIRPDDRTRRNRPQAAKKKP
jgi:endonuclease/exonuclease/phosphatase family metal-dependent hydrolase